MTAWDFLQTAQQRGIKLSVVGDELKYRAPKGALDPELIQGLKANKVEILTIMRRGSLTLIDRKPVSEIIRQSRYMIWFVDQAGNHWRYFPHLARCFPLEIILSLPRRSEVRKEVRSVI